MKKAHPEDYSDYALLLQEDPEMLHPIFLLRNGWCTVYVDDRTQPSTLLIIDSTPDPDIYIIGKWNDWLVPRVEDANPRRVFATEGALRRGSPFRNMQKEEGTIIQWFEEPEEIEWDGEAQRLEYADELEGFPDLLWKNYETAETLIDEGVAFGVYAGEGLAAAATTYALGDEWVSIAACTLPEHQKKGYGEDATRALLKYCMDERAVRPVLVTLPGEESMRALAKKLGFPNEMPAEMDVLTRLK
jgi:RimJ/RimL family protein N-acetyltransferase